MNDLHDDAPITLDEAARVLLRGIVKASTLATAARKGELEVERLGRRLVTTPAAVRAWRERSRVAFKSRAPQETSGDVALAAARTTAARLRAIADEKRATEKAQFAEERAEARPQHKARKREAQQAKKRT